MNLLDNFKRVEIPKRYSVSQLKDFSNCPFVWFCKKGLKAPQERPFGIMLYFGSMMHKFIEYEIKEQGKTTQSLTRRYIADFEAKYKEMLASSKRSATAPTDNAFLFPKTSAPRVYPADFIGMIDLALKYLKDNNIYSVSRESIEKMVTTPVCDVKLLGYIDCVLPGDDGPIDWKCKGTEVKNIEFFDRMQCCYYAYTQGSKKGRNVYFCVNQRKKTNRLSVVEQKYSFSEKDFDIMKAVFVNISKTMEAKNFYPNRMFRWCSEKYCSFWNLCHEYWGF